MTDLRILVVAGDPLARAGLTAILAGRAGLQVAAQVGFSPDLGDDIRLHAPDLLLVDLGWDAGRLGEAIERIQEAGLPAVALAPDKDTAEQAWNAGLQGVLLREVTPARLAAALQAVAAGLSVTLPGLAAVLHAGWVKHEESLVEALTPRELEVLQCLAQGASNKEISRRLEISEHTVKFHINALLGKLGVQSRTEAVVRATRLGLVVL
jgi:two-component system, NarL family, nitrate/nitrite response regulator NarL